VGDGVELFDSGSGAVGNLLKESFHVLARWGVVIVVEWHDFSFLLWVLSDEDGSDLLAASEEAAFDCADGNF